MEAADGPSAPPPAIGGGCPAHPLLVEYRPARLAENLLAGGLSAHPEVPARLSVRERKEERDLPTQESRAALIGPALIFRPGEVTGVPGAPLMMSAPGVE